MNYWDEESGLLKAVPWERDQNMLLRTAYFHLFGGKNIDGIKIGMSLAAMYKKGNWAQHPFTTYKKDRSSHDEMTSVFYFSSIHPEKEVSKIYLSSTKVYKYLFYPQVFFFLLACKYKWKWAIEFAYIAMYSATSKKEKAKSGKWDTDGALLTLLKIEAFKNLGINNPWKDRELEFNISSNWGDKKELIKEMLSDHPNHPLMELMNGQ